MLWPSHGDVVLSDPWRLMSGLEALCGFVLVGWTTALLFMVVQRGLPMNRHWPEWHNPPAKPPDQRD